MHGHMIKNMQAQQHRVAMYEAKRREATGLINAGRYRDAVEILSVLLGANPGDDDVRRLRDFARCQIGGRPPAAPPVATPTTASRGHGRPAVSAVAVTLLLMSLLAAVGVGAYAAWATWGPSANYVHGVVKPQTQWNLRAGPNAKAGLVGQVEAGDRVTVICVSGRWARLSEPRSGAYVYAPGLDLQRQPRPC
jgi:hypothetical protein